MKQLFLYVLSLVFILLTCASFRTSYKSEYIDAFADMAVEEMKLYGIPASIKLAQSIIETNWGVSSLAVQANNFFGIKCKENWEGPTFFHVDDDRDQRGKLIPSCFRAYKDSFSSFRDHSEFLSKRRYYKDLFKLDPMDYKAWATGLKKSGYATDPNYHLKLIHIIEQYDLYLYDKMVTPAAAAGEEER